MQIDLEHLHYWMCAIRESEDPKRTLDAFWRGQIDSKLWLIENIKPFINRPNNIDIHGGWVGVLASLIFQSSMPVRKIRSIDIDHRCETVSRMMNKKEEIDGRFEAVTADMCEAKSTAEVVINTSCEHITQKQYDQWLMNRSRESLLILQSNNYEISEHVRIASSLEEFVKQSHVNVLWKGELKLSLYTRYMIIGKIDV